MNSDPAPFRRAAAHWLALQDRGLTAAEQDEFHAWLAADPRHSEWYARHRAGWLRLDQLSAWRPAHGTEPNPDLLAPPAARPRYPWLRPVLLAAAALAVMAAGALTLRHAGPAPVAIAGGYERRVLEDGSAIELTGDAEIEVHFTPGERRVGLRRGEALFTVTKDAARPFVVQAGGVAVRAVGTAFNVRLNAERVEVLVTEGRVRVAPPTTAAAPLVAAGERAVVPFASGATPRVAPATEADFARLRAWQPQLLDFADTPLAEVVAEFNRRNRVQLILADPALGRLPIAASIRSDNLEGFARLLASGAGLRAERQGDYRVVLRPAD